MKVRSHMMLLVTCLVLILPVGCSKDHDLNGVVNPRDPAYGGTEPPVPTDVTIDVDNRQIVVSWQLPDSSLADQVRSYRIWRRPVLSETAELADSSGTSPKTVLGIANGQTVWISVSSVLTNGLEGRRSTEGIATPGFYAVAINEGQSVTRSRSARLYLTAPSGTSAAVLCSQADMSESVTLEFQPVLSWTLDEGDGQKNVYARFVDLDGNHSSIVSDQIRLDTRAEIIDFYFEGSETRAPGDLIVFRLQAAETGGTAEVEISRGGPRRILRDDGVDPDEEAADGIYSLRYEAERSLQFLGAEMIGHFTDEAGNVAPERPAPRQLTVHTPPPALVLYQPTSAGPEEITLEWSRVPEGTPFASYRLYRAQSPGVDTLASRRLVREVGDPSQTTQTDAGVIPGRVYYYRVELVDPIGVATPSNEVSGSAKPNDAPEAVVLDPPYAITSTSVSLSWTRSFEEDFAGYHVLRGEQPGVLDDPQRRTVNEIPIASGNSYTDEIEIEQGKSYYYVVEVVDALGASAPSNEVSATIDDIFPGAVILGAPDPAGETTISLSWSRSADLDFGSYLAYRAESPGVDETDELVVTLTEAERTYWLDTGLRENTDYYYRVYVRDKGGHATPSNELRVTTENADPPAVSLSAPTEVPGAPSPSVTLNWTAASLHDFESYRLYRDTSPVVGQDATLVRLIDNQQTTTYEDSDLGDNTRYYYRVFVSDNAGAATASNEQSIITANRPPTPVMLSIAATTTSSISLSWTPNGDADFLQYRLQRGTSPGSINTTVVTLTHPEQTTYTDFLPGQDPNQDLFYKVVVYDKELDGTGSDSSDSNIVSGRVSEQ